jgi:hypothetical protein
MKPSWLCITLAFLVSALFAGNAYSSDALRGARKLTEGQNAGSKTGSKSGSKAGSQGGTLAAGTEDLDSLIDDLFDGQGDGLPEDNPTVEEEDKSDENPPELPPAEEEEKSDAEDNSEGQQPVDESKPAVEENPEVNPDEHPPAEEETTEETTNENTDKKVYVECHAPNSFEDKGLSVVRNRPFCLETNPDHQSCGFQDVQACQKCTYTADNENAQWFLPLCDGKPRTNDDYFKIDGCRSKTIKVMDNDVPGKQPWEEDSLIIKYTQSPDLSSSLSFTEKFGELTVTPNFEWCTDTTKTASVDTFIESFKYKVFDAAGRGTTATAFIEWDFSL